MTLCRYVHGTQYTLSIHTPNTQNIKHIFSLPLNHKISTRTTFNQTNYTSYSIIYIILMLMISIMFFFFILTIHFIIVVAASVWV